MPVVSSTREHSQRIARIVAIIGLFCIVLPLLWAISLSLRPPEELFNSAIFVFRATLNNYRQAFEKSLIGYIANSLFVSAGSAVGALSIAMLAAYAFSRLHFPGKRLLFMLIILGQLVPIAAIVLPMYRAIRTIGLINTRLGLIIAYLSFTTPVSIWIMKGFFDKVPRELEEAAIIDGCTHLGAFWRIILPISAPGMIATFIWLIIATWQEIIYALTLITRVNRRTVAVGIFDFFDQYTVDYGTLFAASIAISLPIVLIFLFLQRYFIAGLSESGIKG